MKKEKELKMKVESQDDQDDENMEVNDEEQNIEKDISPN